MNGSTIRRRRLGALVLVGATASALLVGAAPAAAEDKTGPPTVTVDDVQFTPGVRLHYGSAREAGLDPRDVHHLGDSVARYLKPSPTHPQYAGAVEIAGHDGVIASHRAVGYALRYASYDTDTNTATELPRDEWVPARKDTIFDLASISKLFTSIAAVQLIERGAIDLDASVVSYIPEFGQNGKGDITVHNLLTHTSGLPPAPVPSLCDYDTNTERWAAVYATEPQAPPDTEYIYSDLNMMTMQKVIETVAGKSLDQVVQEQITGPLRMHDTMYNPPARLKPRIAATEYQPWTGRGIVRGTVHDENAYCLGGVAGHAGMFSTAHDLAVLAQTILNGGRYGDTRVLSPSSVRSLLTNLNDMFPGDQHGLGFELSQRWYMDALTSPVTAGHTGYTGPALVIDPLSHSFVVLLANRVHPTREWGSNNPSRRAVAHDLALALPVRPAEGDYAWHSATGDERTARLGLPLEVPAGGGRMSFDLWYDTEAGYDIGSLRASTDDGRSWQRVPLDLRAGRYNWSSDGRFSGFAGRRWATVDADLPAGVTDLVWTYTTDTLYQGRGVYVDGVRAWSSNGDLLFDSSRPRDATAFRPDGWVRIQHNGWTR